MRKPVFTFLILLSFLFTTGISHGIVDFNLYTYQDSLVYVEGDRLMLDGKPFIMKGFNYLPRDYGWTSLDDWDWDAVDQELALADLQDQAKLQEWASQALDTLNARERYIIQKRILSEEPETLKDLGEHFGVTRERARQIERAALQKLKGNYLHSELAAA